MYVSFDDTDSNEGLCTTFLATEVMKEIDDLDLIGYPRLVRLNPAFRGKHAETGPSPSELDTVGEKRPRSVKFPERSFSVTKGRFAGSRMPESFSRGSSP